MFRGLGGPAVTPASPSLSACRSPAWAHTLYQIHKILEQCDLKTVGSKPRPPDFENQIGA